MATVTGKAPAATVAPDLVVRSARPVFGAGLVARPRLLSRLREGSGSHVALLSAPAGYGKTTLLSELADGDDRPVGWLTLDDRDNDTALFLASLVEVIDEVEPVNDGVLEALSVPKPSIARIVLPRLGRVLESRTRPFLLILDDVHCLKGRDSLAALELVCTHLPAGAQLAMGSRAEPALRLGRMRAHRRLTELTTRDLAMTPTESRQLLEVIGIDLKPAELEAVIARTEGWPAALYLAGLALREQSNVARAVSRFTGDDRIVVDYLRDEFLSQVSPARLRFLTGTAILDRLSGPLCNAVLERSDSARVLRDLSRSNLLLVALDRTDDVYRYHALFAEMLLSELRRLEPDVESELHRRASDWYADHRDLDRAISHAIEAEDAERAGELIWATVPEYISRGRNASLQSWLNQFSEDQIGASPHLALTAAHSAISAGDGAAARRWTAAASCLEEKETSRTEDLNAAVAILRAELGADGVRTMLEDAERASRLEPEDSPWRSVCSLMEGVAAHLAGDRDRGRRKLEEGARRGAATAPIVQVLCLAQLALLALQQEDRHTAGILASQARAQVERSGLHDYPSMALVISVSALVCAQEGRVEDALRDLKHAKRLLGMLTELPTWYEAESRIALARACLKLGDITGGEALLADAARFLESAPDAVMLLEWLQESEQSLGASSTVAGSDGWGLTPAEVRLLPFLPTHLSFREIAEQLFVSPNTVKTQAQAVYRKLDCSGRAEAVEVARRGGMLNGSEVAGPTEPRGPSLTQL